VKEYINLLRTRTGRSAVHRAFPKRPEPTVIVIVGDHLPAGPTSRSGGTTPISPNCRNRAEWKQRSVPLLVWPISIFPTSGSG
jgi:hypothetical protein